MVLWLLVNAEGSPQNVALLRPFDTDLDKLAVVIAEADRFKPGTHNGRAVPVTLSLDMSLQGCVQKAKSETGDKTTLRLRSQPVQKLEMIVPPAEGAGPASSANVRKDPLGLNRDGAGVTAPVPLNAVEAQYTDAARRTKIQGICLVRLIVDAWGMPQNPRVIRSLDPGLEENAVEAVKKYRFKPAMKGNVPVPVMITVEVNFRLG